MVVKVLWFWVVDSTAFFCFKESIDWTLVTSDTNNVCWCWPAQAQLISAIPFHCSNRTDTELNTPICDPHEIYRKGIICCSLLHNHSFTKFRISIYLQLTWKWEKHHFFHPRKDFYKQKQFLVFYGVNDNWQVTFFFRLDQEVVYLWLYAVSRFFKWFSKVVVKDTNSREKITTQHKGFSISRFES